MKHTHRGSGEKGQPEPNPQELADRINRDLQSKVDIFYSSVVKGIMPTLSEYRTFCATRARLLRENIKTIDQT